MVFYFVSTEEFWVTAGSQPAFRRSAHVVITFSLSISADLRPDRAGRRAHIIRLVTHGDKIIGIDEYIDYRGLGCNLSKKSQPL